MVPGASTTDLSFGIAYTPSGSLWRPLAAQALKDHGIKYIRFQWLDLANILRYRVIPLAQWIKILESSRPSISLLKVNLSLVVLHIPPGFVSTGEYIYKPDLSSLRVIPYAPGQASVMGYYEEKVPLPGPDGVLTLKVDLDARAALHRVCEQARASANVEFLVGFESEFTLLKSTSPIEAVSCHNWSTSYALPSGSVQAQVLEEIAESLLESGIDLLMYHAEAGPGQYEVVTGPLQPLEAADALVLTRETIYNIAAKHGLRATFAPRLFSDKPGSSAHAHISVHSASAPKPSSPSQLSQVESSFLAGLLANLPALMSMTLPLPSSYGRMLDGIWSGGTYVCYGMDNREAPIRLCNAASPHSRNFEFRTMDGTANPYIALAAIFGVGLEAIIEGKKLEAKNCSDGRTAAEMTEIERAAMGITERLPLNLKEARKRTGESMPVKKVFGANFVQKYLSVNEVLEMSLKRGNEKEEAEYLILQY